MKKILLLLAAFCSLASMAAECFAYGNTVVRYKKVMPLVLKSYKGFDEFIAALDKKPAMILLSNAGRSSVVAKPADIQKVTDYVKNGGIMFIDQATPCIFKGKNIRDLSPIGHLLGKSSYFYGQSKIEASELGKLLLGADFKLNQGRNCGLSGNGAAKVLAGTEKLSRITVNRYGKGLVIYYYMTTPPPKAFFEKFFDAEFCRKHFPVPTGNSAVKINGKVKNLAVTGAPGFFLKKLQEITGAKEFKELGIENEVVISFKPAGGWAFSLEFKDGKNIILSGNKNFAAGEFLQRFAGYRNFGHGWFNEVIEKRPSIELPEKFSISEKPDIISYTVAWRSNSPYGRNLRSSVIAKHSLYKVIPVDRYAKSNPEYFPMVNGKRRIPVIKSGTWNPCMCNPDLAKLLRAYFIDFFKKNPDAYAVPLGVNDGQGDCRCPGCEALFKKYNNQYAEFYNLAGRELKKLYPGKIVSFLAYGPRVFNAPRGIKMEDNLLVQVCSIGIDWPVELEKWKAAGIKHTGIYEYLYANGTRYVVPRHFPRREAARWRRGVKELGLEALWIEYYPRVEATETLRMYILDRLAWDLNSDIDALIDDYCTKMFGGGAGDIKKFYERLEEIFSRCPPEFYFADNRSMSQFKNYTREDLAFLNRALDKAVSKSSGIHRKKAELLRKFWKLSELYIANNITIRELATENDPEKVVKLAADGFAGIEKIRNYSFSTEEHNGIFLKNGFAHFQGQSRMNPIHPLNTAIEAAFSRVTAALGKDAARKFWAKHSTLKSARNQLYMMDNKPVNLLKNPGFEPAEGKTDMAFKDMMPFKGVAGWGTWRFQNSVTDFVSDYNVKRSGKASARIGENQVSGCFQTSVKVESGATYRFSVWVRRSDANADKLGLFSIRMTEKGKWADQGSAIGCNFTPECVGKFVCYSITFTVPDRPEMKVIPLLMAPVQKPGSYIWFDDAELVKIGQP